MSAKLVDHFSVRHPRYQFIDVAHQRWDGWYRKYDERNGRLRRPLLNELKLFAKHNNYPLKIIDKRPKEKHPADQIKVTPGLLSGITLEPYQIRAIKAMCNNEVGLISSPTGSGKTEKIAAITKLYNLPTVIIAEQRIVIEQLKERLELREVSDSNVGLFYGGERPNGQPVVVGSIQSLTTPNPPKKRTVKSLKKYKARRNNAKLFQEIVRKAKLLLVDEADRATDKRYRKLFLDYYQGRYKFGFSATCFDKDKPVEALILKEHLGSIICEIPRKEVENAGRIIPIQAVMIAVGEDGDKYDKTAYDIAQRELIIENDKYHQLIKAIISSFPDEKTLILVDTNNVRDLGAILQEKIDGSVFIFGDTSKKMRREALSAFERGELKCLIGGKILKRGLDIKGGMHNLIICGGGKLSSDFNQKIGRAVRKNGRGWARLFSFFHLDNYYLYKHSKEQLKTIVSLDYNVQVVVNGKRMDGRELIRKRFRLPKR